MDRVSFGLSSLVLIRSLRLVPDVAHAGPEGANIWGVSNCWALTRAVMNNPPENGA